MNFSDIIKGALLHDIGKFIMRANKKNNKTHQEIGAGWLEEQGIAGTISVFALRHHHMSGKNARHDQLDVFSLPTNETLIVYEADNLSSGERPEKKGEGKWQANTPLMSVFSKISLEHKPGKPAYRNCWHYHDLGSSEGALRFPGKHDSAQASCGPDGYSSLLSSFKEEFNKLLPELNIDALLVLLEKYTSYIPSETRLVEGKPESFPDVSLFDHLKTTAAIAACLYRYIKETCPDYRENLLKDKILDRKDPRYMLVGGDFSGVQKFIYTISSKGALKTLRARSFFLELLTEHVVAEILERMNLPRANIIYTGGGRFYLLAPNTSSCREVLKQIDIEINGLLYYTYHGQLYLALEKVEFTGEAFMPRERAGRDLAWLWGELRSLLTKKKSRKFSEQIAADPDSFWLPAEPGDKVCDFCHTDSAKLIPLRKSEEGEETIEVCQSCRQLYELGDDLPNAKYIARSLVKPPQGIPYLTIGTTYYTVCSNEEVLDKLNAQAVYVLNSWSCDDYLRPGAVQLFIGAYTTRQDRGYKSFDTLAKEAAGADRIGIMRMDVDNLGTIFTRGLPESGRTFSRLTALSRSLTQFFKFYINEICEGVGENFSPLRLLSGKGRRNVTIVYAGGDDLFLVGAWNDVAELSFDIADCFRRYTGQNPDVTISGGMVVQDAKYPLYKLADLAGEAEERAKDNGRDSISLFYTSVPDFTRDGRPIFTGTFKWSEANHLLKELLTPAVSGLAKQIADENRLEFLFSKNFMHKLAAVTDIWRREGKLYLPRLAYTLARESEHKELKNNGAWPEWKQKIYDIKNITYLRTAVTWMDLLSRRGAEDGRNEESAKWR